MKAKLILFFSILVFGINQAETQTIYVDANNTTGAEDGTSSHPFNTIKKGIASANQGDTVFIKEGTYLPDEGWNGNDSILYLKASIFISCKQTV